MKRKNPSSASLPNMPIDLTALLDVVFIVLFVVMISVVTSKISYEQYSEEKAEEYEQDLKRNREEMNDLKKDLLDKTTKSESYKQRISDLEENGPVIGTRVKIVTIHGEYIATEDETNVPREIVIITPDGETEPVKFDNTNEKTARSRLKSLLEEYIQSVTESSESDDAIIIMSINTDGILYRDKKMIDEIYGELKASYSNVH